ncbi:MAG TPA: CopG family antitoxin [Pyrinomonadaceae bacterium]|jgi:hypothetical protein
MANTKDRSKVKKQRDPLPEHFTSLEEAAEFWDTHSSADYEDYMRDIEYEVSIKRKVYLVELNNELYDKVRVIAQEKGIPAEVLVNQWVKEKV